MQSALAGAVMGLLACGQVATRSDAGGNRAPPPATTTDAEPDGSSSATDAPTTGSIDPWPEDTTSSGTGDAADHSLTLWLATDGDDTNSGGPDAPLRTLQRAHDLLTELSPKGDMTIVVAAGTYAGQCVEWEHTRPTRRLRVVGEDAYLGRPDPQRPVFDGATLQPDGRPCADPDRSIWFRLVSMSGEPTNVQIEHIQVQHYLTAIELRGDQNDHSRSNGDNRVENCRFAELGQMWVDDAPSHSTAAIRLLNSDRNVFIGNTFEHIENHADTKPSALHSIYAAHGSECNTIIENVFTVGSGDPVKFRDASHFNLVRENVFRRTGSESAVTAATSSDGDECRSWENAIRCNLINGDYGCDFNKAFRVSQVDGARDCVTPTGATKEIRTAHNVDSAEPCVGEPLPACPIPALSWCDNGAGIAIPCDVETACVGR